MIKSKIESRPLLRIPVGKYGLWLVDYKGAPFVPLEPVCAALGLNFKGQVSRLRRSKKPYGIKSVTAHEGEKQLYLEAVPLENLTAFLFTLKPNIPNRVILRNFQRTIARSLIFFWSRYQREYCMPKTVAAELATLTRLERPNPDNLPTPDRAKKDSRITPDTVERIKTLKTSGISISGVSRQTGYSRTTVSLILSGKYKTVAAGTLPPL